MARIGLGLVLIVCAISAFVAAEEIRLEPGVDLQAVIDAAPSHATILLAPGEYVGGLLISRPISIRGTGGSPSECVILPPEFGSDLDRPSSLVHGYSREPLGSSTLVVGVTDEGQTGLENLRIRAATYSNIGEALVVGADSHVLVSNCELDGALFAQSSQTEILNTLFRLSYWEATLSIRGAARVSLDNCEIDGRGGRRELGGSNLYVGGEAEVVCRELTALNVAVGIEIDDQASVRLEGNCLLGGSFAAIWLHSPDATASYTDEPPLGLWYSFDLEGRRMEKSYLATIAGYSSPDLRERTQAAHGSLRVAQVPLEFRTLQEGLDALQPGGLLYVDTGHYQGPVIIDKSVSIIGVGPEILLDVQSTAISILESADDVLLANLRLESSSACIVNYSTDLVVDSCSFIGHGTGAILGGESSAVFSLCSFEMEQAGIRGFDEASVRIQDSVFSGCETGVEIEDGARLSIENCEIKYSAESGITGSDLDSGASIDIVDCVVHHSGGAGVAARGNGVGSKFSAVTSDFTNNTEEGLDIPRFTSCEILNCQVEGNGKAGILMYAAVERADLRDLAVRDNGGFGLDLGAGFYSNMQGDVLVQRCQVMENASGGISVGGPGRTTLDQVVIESNLGLAIRADSAATLEVSDCTFQGNQGTPITYLCTECVEDGDEIPPYITGWLSGERNRFLAPDGAQLPTTSRRVCPSWLEQELQTRSVPIEVTFPPEGTDFYEFTERLAPGSTVRLEAGVYEAGFSISKSLNVIGQGNGEDGTRVRGRISPRCGSHGTIRLSDLTIEDGIALLNSSAGQVIVERVSFEGSASHASHMSCAGLTMIDCDFDGGNRNYWGLLIDGLGEIELRSTSFAHFERVSVGISSHATLDMHECSLVSSMRGLLVDVIQFGQTVSREAFGGTITGSSNWIPGPETEGGNSIEAVYPSSLLETLPDGFFRSEPFEEASDAD